MYEIAIVGYHSMFLVESRWESDGGGGGHLEFGTSAYVH